jgi:hypothetical protein
LHIKGDISLFAGLVKADLALKDWGREFKALAANLPELKKSTPKLPSSDFTRALTADEKELNELHQTYIKAIDRQSRHPATKTTTRNEKKNPINTYFPQ